MLTRFTNDFPALAGRIGKEHLPALLARADYETVPAGTTLIRDQQLVQFLWLIADGVCEVKVEHGGRAIRLGRVGKGLWLGEVSLLTGGAATSTVTAETEVTVGPGRQAEILRLRDEEPEVAGALVREIIDVLMERIRASDVEIQGEAGNLALRGSHEVARARQPPQKGWFRRVLEKLTGVSEPDSAAGGGQEGQS